jgi:hypothetical protein
LQTIKTLFNLGVEIVYWINLRRKRFNFTVQKTAKSRCKVKDYTTIGVVISQESFSFAANATTTKDD